MIISLLIISLLYSIFLDKINATENKKGDCRWRTAANGNIDESSEGYKETRVIALQKPGRAVTDVNKLLNITGKAGHIVTRLFYL